MGPEDQNKTHGQNIGSHIKICLTDKISLTPKMNLAELNKPHGSKFGLQTKMILMCKKKDHIQKLDSVIKMSLTYKSSQANQSLATVSLQGFTGLL